MIADFHLLFLEGWYAGVMNEELQKQLIRQLKLLNFWITIFGTLILIALLITGFMVYKVVSFTNSTRNEIRELKATVSVCEDEGGVGGFIKEQTNLCN